MGSNTTGRLSELFDAEGFDWVSSHTFRKTVATRLDEAGLTERQMACSDAGQVLSPWSEAVDPNEQALNKR